MSLTCTFKSIFNKKDVALKTDRYNIRQVKIVDSFLFSEPYEKELLLLKFVLENEGVDEWLILENSYTFQGDYKGLYAQSILDNDERFKPFIHKIKIISAEEKNQKLEKDPKLDPVAFNAEYKQRNLAYDHFINHYNDDDWIIISDTDESLDFSSAIRKQELLQRMKMNQAGVLHVCVKRFWYDFDNEYKILYGIPVCTKKYLITNNLNLHDVRIKYHADLKMKWDNIIGFEYSSCFNLDHIFRKSDTYSHIAVSQAEIKQALRCNHRPVSKYWDYKMKNSKKFFFEKVALNEYNSPSYVRSNFARLATNNIDTQYQQNRKVDYPQLFTIQHYLNNSTQAIGKYVSKKFRYACRLLHIENFIYGSSIH